MRAFKQFGCFAVVAVVGLYILSFWHGNLPSMPGKLGDVEQIMSTGAYPLPLVAPSQTTADFINRVLAANHSPAKGTGGDFVAGGARTGINPLIGLAFFHQESTFGLKGEAIVTKSIGNIRCSAGYRCADGYRAYPNWEAGISDWFTLMKWYVSQGHTTVEQAIPVYAPGSDGNDVQGYIQSVRADVARWQQGRL